MSRAAWVGLVLVASAALAEEPKPEVAPFPLEIVRTPANCTTKDAEDLQMLLPMMLRAADASVPDSAKLSAALAKLGGSDCSRDDACLSKLGKLAGSLYAFFVQLDFDLDGNVVASGRVVREDGRAAGDPKTVKIPHASTSSCRETAGAALKQLLVELDVAHLSPFRPQEQAVATQPAPLVATSPAPRPVLEPVTLSSSRPRFRVPALVAAAGGVLCLGVGGGLFATAGEVRTDVSQGVVRVFSDDASKVTGIVRAQTAGVALLAVGAGLGALGAGLYLLGPEETTSALVPINGGAAWVISGSLP